MTSVHQAGWFAALSRLDDDRLAETERCLVAVLRRAQLHHDIRPTLERIELVRELRRRRAEVGCVRCELEVPWMVVPCSAAKLPHPAPAAQLYTGSFTRFAFAAADAVACRHRTVVLSGRYGLVRADEILTPYEQRIDRPGAVDDATLAGQVHTLGLDRSEVWALTGRVYHDRLARVLDTLVWPLEGCRGIGGQRAVLAAIVRRELRWTHPALRRTAGQVTRPT